MKKTVITLVAILVLLLFGFVVYSYLTPDISITVGKPVDPNTERYVQQVQIGSSTKFGLPMPGQIKDRINEFYGANEATIQSLYESYTLPMKVDAKVEVAGKKTVVTYTGQATNPDGTPAEINEQLEFDFVLTDKIS